MSWKRHSAIRMNMRLETAVTITPETAIDGKGVPNATNMAILSMANGKAI